MRLNRDGFSIEAAIEKGRPLPDWYLDEPLIYPADRFYLEAFVELNTGRNAAFGLSAISWRDLVDYAAYKELDKSNTQLFMQVMREMDKAYIDWQEANKPGK